MPGTFTEAEFQQLSAALKNRQSKVGRLIEVAERVCSKLKHPTTSVTIFDQDDLRAALDNLKSEAK